MASIQSVQSTEITILWKMTASSDASMVDLNEAHGGAAAGRPRRILSFIRGCAYLASRSIG